jgi:hypothetical protein
MALFIPVPDVAEAHIRGTLNGQPVENTLYFWKSGGWSITPLGLLATALREWFHGGILTDLSREYQFREVYVADLTSSEGATATDSTDAGTAGGIDSDTSSNQAAFVVKFNTALRGRSNRGRNYVCGVPENQVAGSKVNSTWANFVRNQYSSLAADFGILGFKWVAVSRYHNLEPRLEGTWNEIVVASYTTLAVRNQRRRQKAA